MNTPAQHRCARIEALAAEAERLHPAATEEWMKEQVRLASLHLAEASTWVRQEHFDSQSSTIRIVDRLLELAEARLRLVDDAFVRVGGFIALDRATSR